MARVRFLAVLCLAIVLDLSGQIRDDQEMFGDRAMAEKYIAWAQTAIVEGRWAEALAALERGADFSEVSSDLAYLLALTRSHENRPRGAVLEAVQHALEIDRWNRYNPALGKALKAEALIRIRRYAEALANLADIPQTINTACLKLLALKGLGDGAGFTAFLAEVMHTYPREPRPIQIFFEYAENRVPAGNEGELMILALKRLPVLLEADRELACRAAPFISDIEEARRIIGAYRAGNTGIPASIPPALNLGLIDGHDGVDELFRTSLKEEKKLDKGLLLGVWNLLRDDSQRDRFRGHLSDFSGVITEDRNNDGYSESLASYNKGMLIGYTYDEDQDGLPELTVFFEGGIPVRMETVSTPNVADRSRNKPFGYPPVTDTERIKALVYWERYPLVLETRLEEVVYKPKPFDFSLFPLYFTKLAGDGLLYPEHNLYVTGLSSYTLVFSSLIIERPSREFAGAFEQIELDQGIPYKAREFLNGHVVSETAFHLGRPLTQRIDLDGNGHLETIRYFKQPENLSLYAGGLADGNPLDFERIIEFSKSDWNEDGIFEYEERYIYDDEDSGDFASYTIERFWDMDRDGVLEFSDMLRYVKK